MYFMLIFILTIFKIFKLKFLFYETLFLSLTFFYYYHLSNGYTILVSIQQTLLFFSLTHLLLVQSL